jgi:hypothetical protein
MYGMGLDPGKHDLIQADFEAKLLANGQIPEDDPVEDHMNRVKRVVFWWTAGLVVIAGGILWFAADIAAVVGTACLTAVALAVMANSRRPRARLSRS